ncbi:hypothetical protein PHYSODRAFT_299225 [Phytophthora sojae]|uniref:Tc1-like transposase DDE domain-containing protein n=1 Tax=Phytophthora sojae (strain P6497) TaxID=1094619 RepID=G4Z3Y3_PHYSP|nr:hypothetical protein PHYSODRAFT_299225 [Phytophthora sojae]EGZ21535.1 hypothetical protein PHYSODRAFT_299225 [Phytophthora sojae]|eukprot:XP_009524252.1 hypothetical protein PHYSODRAFT_299225 [Phytophthora sojae]
MVYQSYTLDERQRVLTAAKNHVDWALVARLNGIVYPTTARWVATARNTNVWTAVPSKRGGARHVKMTPERVNFLVALQENNCLLTLNDVIDELKVFYGVDVSVQTVRNALDAVCFSVRKTHAESSAMNSDRVKALRPALRASRHKELERAEFRWGTNNADTIDSFVMALLDGLMDKGVSMFDLVVVCDNASIHTNVKEITRRAEYAGVEFSNLSPYSPMLNPIENVFSVFKSGVKAFLAAQRDKILQVPPNQTKAAHRAHYLLRAAKYSMSVKVTPDLCDSEAAHILSFHAAALDEHDMLVGS